jgi:DNA invertase Pin-like site-specific DNA recombinase
VVYHSLKAGYVTRYQGIDARRGHDRINGDHDWAVRDHRGITVRLVAGARDTSTEAGRGQMTQHVPGSQSRVQMAEKERIARRLLRQGLTIDQVAIQLRCSRTFVSKVKKAVTQETASAV